MEIPFSIFFLPVIFRCFQYPCKKSKMYLEGQPSYYVDLQIVNNLQLYTI